VALAGPFSPTVSRAQRRELPTGIALVEKHRGTG
jgi:hypothetical protein